MLVPGTAGREVHSMKKGEYVMKKFQRIFMGFAIFALLFASFGVSPSLASNGDKFPNRPVTLVIPYGLGSGDHEARTFGRIMEKHLGVTMVPSNHEGGSGAIGVGYLLAQPADGYAVSFMSATIAFGMASGNLKFAATDIQPLGTFNADYLCFAVEKDSPFKTLDDMVKFAKEKPGYMNVGGTNVNGAHHVFANLFFKDADIKAQYIPYNGSNQTLVALLGKNLDVMVTSPSTIRQHVAVGDIRILAVSTSARVTEFPEVPTCKELGYETIDDFLNFRGYFVKPGTPEDVLKVLDEAFKKAYHDPEYQAFIEKEQLVPFYKGRPEVGEYFNKFVAQAEALIKGEK